ncbi:MAG: aromatic ring-hydroxylating dioxygenase subunit alpha, partial [Pseudomonadota bacterium]
AWADDVPENELFARTILGEPVVLYRTESGSIAALEDRCCHRLAPLSKGRIEGDAVRCMYHGLKFGSSGECLEIPGETQIPNRYRVRTFPVVEKQKLIWIWIGDAALADPADIVDWPYLDDEAWRYKGGYLHYKASYRRVIDNFLDFSHLPYVHEKTIGTAAYADNRPVTEYTDYGAHIRNIAKDDVPAPFFKKYGGFEDLVDRWSLYHFHIRGNCLLMDLGTIPTGQGGHEGDRKNALEFRHISVITPETETSAHYHFAQIRNFGLDVDELDDGILTSVVEAFLEDREIIEAQQRVIDLDPDAPMAPIAADRALLKIGREINRAIEAESLTAEAAE